MQMTVLLSPTLDWLQEMIKTCSDYTKHRNLSFSTHNNPKKSKTKCMSFLKKKRILKNMKLNDNELMQEFHDAHTSTKTMLNNVFNTHFYGPPLT